MNRTDESRGQRLETCLGASFVPLAVAAAQDGHEGAEVDVVELAGGYLLRVDLGLFLIRDSRGFRLSRDVVEILNGLLHRGYPPKGAPEAATAIIPAAHVTDEPAIDDNGIMTFRVHQLGGVRSPSGTNVWYASATYRVMIDVRSAKALECTVEPPAPASTHETDTDAEFRRALKTIEQVRGPVDDDIK